VKLFVLYQGHAWLHLAHDLPHLTQSRTSSLGNEEGEWTVLHVKFGTVKGACDWLGCLVETGKGAQLRELGFMGYQF
jgi:hypothetical protein